MPVMSHSMVRQSPGVLVQQIVDAAYATEERTFRDNSCEPLHRSGCSHSLLIARRTLVCLIIAIVVFQPESGSHQYYSQIPIDKLVNFNLSSALCTATFNLTYIYLPEVL